MMILQSIFFYQLLLAHFLSDYNFQTDRVFLIKIKYPLGVSLHAAICLLTWLAFSFPYLGHPMMWVNIIFFGFILHVGIDKGKMMLNKALGMDSIWFFILDQVLHMCCAYAIVYFALTGNYLPMVLPPVLDGIYNNPHVINALTWYVVITYAANIFVTVIKINYFARFFSLPITFPKPSTKYIGILERGLMATFIWWGGWFFLLVPVAAAPSIYFSQKKEKNFSIIDLLLSWGWAVMGGVALRFVTK